MPNQFYCFKIKNIEILLQDLIELNNDEWIKDSIIEGYLNAICDLMPTPVLVLNYFHATSIFFSGKLYYNEVKYQVMDPFKTNL